MTKPFNPDTELYDMDHVVGRFTYINHIFSPKNLFYSSSTLYEYQKNIDYWKINKESKLDNCELWRQHYIVKSNMHPETKEPVQIPFRWSCYVPVQIPIVYATYVLPRTTFNQVISQSVNQIYNFGVNYNNSSASNPMSAKDIAASLCLTLGSAVTFSVGIRKLLSRIHSTNIILKSLLFMTPYFGVAGASSMNLFFSRYKDVLHGVEVIDPETNEIYADYKSKIAGWNGFITNLFVRFAIPVPTMLFPVISDNLFKKYWNAYRTKKIIRYPIVSFIIYLSLTIGVFGGQSLFKPMGSIKLKY